MLSLPQLRGYVLEESLARLIHGAGYRLLVDPSQDPEGLTAGPHGLLVRGRGSNHQADVLGQLLWVPTFSLPIRLFVEAKYQSKPVGLSVVRNAHGVIADVNEYYRTDAEVRPVLQRHLYRYAVFSATGFTADAADYALTQQISLVDLSGPSFAPLLTVVGQVAENLHSRLQAVRGEHGYVRRGDLRNEIRQVLATWTAETPPTFFAESPMLASQIRAPAVELADRLQGFGQLFLGAPEAPFVLVLRADRPSDFVQSLMARPVQQVRIYWSIRGNRSDWFISPVEDASTYTLTFGLPVALENWLFGRRDQREIQGAALELKSGPLSAITVSARQGEQSVVGRLLYSADRVRPV